MSLNETETEPIQGIQILSQDAHSMSIPITISKEYLPYIRAIAGFKNLPLQETMNYMVETMLNQAQAEMEQPLHFFE